MPRPSIQRLGALIEVERTTDRRCHVWPETSGGRFPIARPEASLETACRQRQLIDRLELDGDIRRSARAGEIVTFAIAFSVKMREGTRCHSRPGVRSAARKFRNKKAANANRDGDDSLAPCEPKSEETSTRISPPSILDAGKDCPSVPGSNKGELAIA